MFPLAMLVLLALRAGGAAPRRYAGWWWLVLGMRSGGGRARGLLRLWPWWERFYQRVFPAQHIPGSKHDLLRVRFSVYHGPPLILPDGTRVDRGDPIGELHLNNLTIVRATAEGTFTVLKMLRQDLAALAAWTEQPDFPSRITAFFGVTLLGSGAVLAGFWRHERPRTIRARLDRFFMDGLLIIYNPDGQERLARGGAQRAYPEEVWISRARLTHLRGARHQPSGATDNG